MIVRYVLISLWLGAAAGAASALTVGAARGGVVLGRPVDVAVEVTPDPGKALADSCIAAEVLTGDRPLSRVRVLPLPEVPGRTPLVRIQTAAIVHHLDGWLRGQDHAQLHPAGRPARLRCTQPYHGAGAACRACRCGLRACGCGAGRTWGDGFKHRTQAHSARCCAQRPRAG